MATETAKNASGTPFSFELPLTPGRKAETASRPVVLSNEDKTLLEAIVSGLAVDESALFGTIDTVVTRPGFPGGVIPRLYDLQEGMRTPARTVEVTLSTVAAIHTAGQLLADTQEVALAFRINAGISELHFIQVLDESNNKPLLDLLFLDNNASLGTENAAANISGTLARGILGAVSVGAADWINLGASAIAEKTNVGIEMTGASGQSSCWIAAIVRSTTSAIATNSFRVKLGFIQYQ